MILTGRSLCLPSRATVQELFSISRDASIIPDISLDPVLTTFLSLDSSAALQHQYVFLQRSMSREWQTAFRLNLTEELGGTRVTHGGVGVVALALSMLFEQVAQQVRTQGATVTHISTKRSKAKKIFGISASSRIGWIIHNYLTLIPSIANNQDKMAETTELYDNWLKHELLDHYERMTTKKRMSTESMLQWLTGAAFHLHMRIHQVRLHSVPLGSVESLRLSYKTGLNRLVQGYTAYLRRNIQEIQAPPQQKPKTKESHWPKPTNTSGITNVTLFNSFLVNVTMLTASDKLNDSTMPNSTKGNNTDCERDVSCEDFGPSEQNISNSTTDDMRNRSKLNTSVGYNEKEEEEGRLSLLVIEPQRNVSHSVQHHPCESQAIQQALVTRIMKAQDLERNRNFFINLNRVFHSLLRQKDDFELKENTNDTMITFRPSDEILERWSCIPVEKKRDAAQRMKVCVFWLPILLQQEESNAAVWAMDIGLISSKNSENLKMKHLHKIEIVEKILLDMEKGTLNKDSSKHVIVISNMFNLLSNDVFEHALRWLEVSGDVNVRHRLQDLGCLPTCFAALRFIFTEFAKFVQEMGSNPEKAMRMLRAQPDDYLIEKSEEMKKKGNEYFQKQQYEEAVIFYSKAIKFYPDNHIIYGNRALCYIRCQRFLKAVGDGKRAILIKPHWAKGHYRFCEALYSLGELQLALQANLSARTLCKDDHEGIKDLEQQHQKLSEFSYTKVVPPSKAQRVGVVTQRPQPRKGGKTDSAASSAGRCVQNQKGVDGKGDVCKELKCMVQDAQAALYDLRSRNAEQTFSKALALLETVPPKELGLSTVDVLLLLFGRASALTEIGQPEELAEAQKLLEKIKSYEERTFQCLVFYAIGKVYLRENRFAFALQHFSDAMQMVNNQIKPGKLTWPLTNKIVKETQPDCLEEILDTSIEKCKFPPIPDAICRLEKCLCYLKAEIYFTDPDFKGFIQICCCQNCRVEFHITCWKTVKVSTFFEKNEKDILQEACLTPDCIGQICSIKIFGPTGLVKCKFETAISKPQTPKKCKVNQKCTSLKKLKSKEERNLKRKQHKQTFQEKQTINDEILLQKEVSGTQSEQKAWLVYRDRVLLQISQNMDLLKEEKSLQISVLTNSLKPWLELDLLRGNQLAARLLNWQQEPLESFSQAVELLLERKNRVWARVFIQLLSNCVDINPKLSKWACQLNGAGLTAAKSFIERYAGHLEKLDLSLLLKFEPLQEMIIEKLDTRPELFSSIGLSVTEYLNQAPAHDTRLFIWTLEEHRDDYTSCHAILDKYFDMMDGNCSVLKKSDENGVIVLSGMRGVTPREEWDQDFFEDDSLSFLHPADVFSVPSHLREQVADFEDQYNGTRHRTRYKMIMDNNPDPAKESLFDYFAQILEEHGPLMAEDPLLVGEMENFPSVAQQNIQEAGGLEPFLLESLRFIKMGRCIGLAKHAVSLQQSGNETSLDDLDEIVDPGYNFSYPDMHTSLTTYLDNYGLTHTVSHPILPNPYCLDPQSSGHDFFSHWTDGNFDQDSHFLPNGFKELGFDASEANYGVLDTDSASSRVDSVATNEDVLKRHAAVQTCREPMSSVAVNTEFHERFESCPGDINKKEKSNKMLEQQIKKMSDGCYKVNPSNTEDISLEEDIRKITTNIQVTNKELAMFQQKLEEEVKKDQKEKKANQEELKTLKTEMEQLVEEHTKLVQHIREKKTCYDVKLSDFLELSNQSAAEKMSLEDEIKRCKALFNSATRRCCTAQLSVMESSRDQDLYGLYRELAGAKALLTKLDEAVHNFPNQDLEMIRNNCRAKVEEAEKKISAAERQYQEQMDQVKNGRRVCELPRVGISNQPDPAAPALFVGTKEFVPKSSTQAPHMAPAASQHSGSPAAEAPAAPLQMHHKPARKAEPPHSTVFDKAMETLSSMFPDYTRSDLMRYMQELRSSRGGSLNSMGLQDVVGGVIQLILDHQEMLNTARANAVRRGSPAHRGTPPLVTQTPVWQPVGSQRPTKSTALNTEDPCIICHEDMNPDDTCVLECRHSFHEECIKSWLKEQSTCPTCRNHALLPDDFPVLPGRRRQAP
ncbi:E3 ubiquitin-protein ligase TTC3 [Xenentodon cancila]